jgi:hypothetical protein
MDCSNTYGIRNDPGVDSASNRNYYQEFSCGVKGDGPARKANNLTAICDCLENVRASTACYMDSFTFLPCSVFQPTISVDTV